MAAALDTLLAEARSQDLIQPLGAFEVHCRHCHARLSGTGDCATCGLIGRPESELMRRAASDTDAIARLLETSIARRKSFGGRAGLDKKGHPSVDAQRQAALNGPRQP